MRVLVAASCIAIIAGVGYFLTAEYLAYRLDRDAADRQALNDTLVEACREDLAVPKPSKGKIMNCIGWGALTDAEVARRERELDILLR